MDLTTRYLGLTLPSPIVASASPLTGKLDTLKAVAPGRSCCPRCSRSKFWHDKRILDALIENGAESFGEAQNFFPAQAAFATDSGNQVALAEKAAATLEIPVIASLNGTTDSGWTDLANAFQEAGAAAIELNVYFLPTDLALSSAEVEQRTIDVVAAVCDTVSIPVAAKIGPYSSAPGQMAQRIVAAGAKGVVLFNRFYQPDIDPVGLRVVPSLDLSHRHEMRLPLLWIGILAGPLNGSLAATSGVDGPEDVVRYLLAGADVTMTTSALLRHGPEHMGALVKGLETWLAARGLDSPGAIRGRLSHTTMADPEGHERANYIKVMQGYGRA